MPPPFSVRFEKRRILVVEDDILLAIHVKAALDEHGYLVVGPLRAVAPAVKVVSTDLLDAAVLDVNLGSETSFPIADALTAASVPFLFLTASNRAKIPVAHRLRPVVPKPFHPVALVAELARVLGSVTSLGASAQHTNRG